MAKAFTALMKREGTDKCSPHGNFPPRFLSTTQCPVRKLFENTNVARCAKISYVIRKKSVSVSIYPCIQTSINTFVHLSIHISIDMHRCIHANMHAFMQARMHTCRPLRIHAGTLIRSTHAHMRPRTYACMQARTHGGTHTRIYSRYSTYPGGESRKKHRKTAFLNEQDFEFLLTLCLFTGTCAGISLSTYERALKRINFKCRFVRVELYGVAW